MEEEYEFQGELKLRWSRIEGLWGIAGGDEKKNKTNKTGNT